MLRAARRNSRQSRSPPMISALSMPSPENLADRSSCGPIPVPPHQDDDRAGLHLGRQRVGQRKLAQLLGQVVGMTAHTRTMGHRTADKDRRIPRAMTRTAGALLAIHLLGGAETSLRLCVLWVPAWRLASCQRTTRWRMIGANLVNSEDLLVEPGLARDLPSSVLTRQFHHSAPSPSATACAACGRSRLPAPHRDARA